MSLTSLTDGSNTIRNISGAEYHYKKTNTFLPPPFDPDEVAYVKDGKVHNLPEEKRNVFLVVNPPVYELRNKLQRTDLVNNP